VLKTKDNALQEAFPEGSNIVRKTLFLTDEQVSAIAILAKVKCESKLISYYTTLNGESPTQFVFFDSHIVRTKSETFMIVVAADGAIIDLQIVAFYEPMDYLPTRRWFNLFRKKQLDDSLWPNRAIDTVSGATLTTRAVTRAVRKILAIYEIGIK
jgi:hypothetical protein